MQKVIRVALVSLLILVTVGIVLSQTQLYKQQAPVLPWAKTDTQIAAIQPAANTPMGSTELVEREKDREILRAIEKDLARISATSLAQNYLMIFQAIIYFLTLIIIFSLLEQVKKFANAAVSAAEAARISAEAATKSGSGEKGNCGHSHQPKRPDGNKFIMRRLRGNYHKR